MMKQKRTFFLLMVIICFSCKSTDTALLEFEKAPLFGMIYDQSSQPVGGVKVFVDDKLEATSDINGRYVVTELQTGKHAFLFRKDGYEDVAIPMEFVNKTQVLYARMTSFPQLLELAERALDEREWGRCRDYLNRAGKLRDGDPVLLYYQAVLAYKTKDVEAAITILHQLVSRGYKEPAVFLFLADVHEYEKKDREKALYYLKEYSKLKSDPEVESRIRYLGNDVRK